MKKPSKVNFADAACCVGDGIKAYTALHYQANVCGGETVLVMNGASVCGVLYLSSKQQYTLAWFHEKLQQFHSLILFLEGCRNHSHSTGSELGSQSYYNST